MNSNLRYKQGKNLNFIQSDVFVMDRPEEYFLPKQNVSSKYIFAKEDMYFVYQNNYNQFVKMYKNTYQHGGISLEEMLIPLVTLKSKEINENCCKLHLRIRGSFKTILTNRKDRNIICFYGEMGVGKTTLIKVICKEVRGGR